MKTSHVKRAPTPSALQCCLLCGRTLTDREGHDALEQQVLKSIRDEHPEWTDESGACEPCVNHFRQLLEERVTREERALAALRRRWPRFVVAVGAKAAALFRNKEKYS